MRSNTSTLCFLTKVMRVQENFACARSHTQHLHGIRTSVYGSLISCVRTYITNGTTLCPLYTSVPHFRYLEKLLYLNVAVFDRSLIFGTCQYPGLSYSSCPFLFCSDLSQK